MEKTLILIKPDAVQRGLVGTVISRLEKRGLKLVALKMLWMDKALARRDYAVHEGKPFFEKLVNYISSSPIVAAVFEGKRAVGVARGTIGETDPAEAGAGTIRGDLGLDIGRNLVHGSDSVETAEQEIDLFFSSEELLHYQMGVDAWVTEP